MKKLLLINFFIFLGVYNNIKAQVNGPISICQNGTYNYQTAFSSSYAWSVSGGSATIATPNAQTTDITFNDPVAQYTITAITSAPTNTFVLTVTNNTPNSPSTTNASICEGATANVSATGSGTISWFTAAVGGTSVFTGTNYTTPALFSTTNYYAEIVSSGCTSLTRTPAIVTVNPIPVLNPGGSGAICQGATYNIYGGLVSGGPIVTWLWNPGGYTTDNVNVTPSSTTNYTVTATNSNGCVGTATKNVTVNPIPTVSVNSISICNGASGGLTATGATTYSWAPPTGLSSTSGASITATPTSTTTYTVTGLALGCSNTATAVVTVNPIPTVTANPSTICDGQSATLTATGAATYIWNPGALTSASISVSPTITTTYTVTGTSAAGCTNTANSIVTVNPLPVITVNSPAICAGQSTVLTATGAQTYVWNPGSFTSTSISVNPTTSTTYTVTGTSATGCVNTANATVTVNPLPIVNAGPDSAPICESAEVILTGSGGGLVSQTWAPVGGSTVATTSAYSFFPSLSEAFVFIGINSFGCANSDTVFVTVNPSKHILGNITSSAGSLTANAYLLKYNALQLAFDTFEVASVITNQYTFFSIPFDNYLVKIVPDTGLHPSFVPTYYGNEYQWDSATVITHGCASDFGANISIIELSGTTGTGFISGHIVQDEGFGQRLNGINEVMVPGGPLKGIDVKLGKNPGGGIQARTMTDSTGYYEIRDIPNDSYIIYVDIPGLPMDSTYQLTIASGTDNFTDLDYFADSNSVYPLFVDVTGLAKQNYTNEKSISLFPNPTQQNVKVQFETKTEIAKIEIYNMQGLILFSTELKGLAKGKHEIQFDLDKLGINNGAYFIKVSSGNLISTKKLIVSE